MVCWFRPQTHHTLQKVVWGRASRALGPVSAARIFESKNKKQWFLLQRHTAVPFWGNVLSVYYTWRAESASKRTQDSKTNDCGRTLKPAKRWSGQTMAADLVSNKFTKCYGRFLRRVFCDFRIFCSVSLAGKRRTSNTSPFGMTAGCYSSHGLLVLVDLLWYFHQQTQYTLQKHAYGAPLGGFLQNMVPLWANDKCQLTHVGSPDTFQMKLASRGQTCGPSWPNTAKPYLFVRRFFCHVSAMTHQKEAASYQ